MSNYENKEKITQILSLDVNNLQRQLTSKDELIAAVDKIEIIKNSGVDLNLITKNDLFSGKEDIEVVNKILYDNKLLDFTWNLILEARTKDISEVNQIKIACKLKYLNRLSLEIKEINLLLDEEKFHFLSEEISKLVKYFN